MIETNIEKKLIYVDSVNRSLFNMLQNLEVRIQNNKKKQHVYHVHINHIYSFAYYKIYSTIHINTISSRK